METYRVFKRRPWKRNKSWPNGWEPHGGARKTTVRWGCSVEEARRICKEGNGDVVRGKPGQMFHEFERE
jgi:hypothetical protein